MWRRWATYIEIETYNNNYIVGMDARLLKFLCILFHVLHTYIHTYVRDPLCSLLSKETTRQRRVFWYIYQRYFIANYVYGTKSFLYLLMTWPFAKTLDEDEIAINSLVSGDWENDSELWTTCEMFLSFCKVFNAISGCFYFSETQISELPFTLWSSFLLARYFYIN